MLSALARAGLFAGASSRSSRLVVSPGMVAQPSEIAPMGARLMGTARSHSASKKRFKPRGKGGMVYKPSGRKHGMHRHSRNRNRQKGAAVVISRNENGDMWRRLRAVHIDMRARRVNKPTKAVVTGTETVYQFSTQVTSNKSLLSIVSTEVTKDMAPTVIAASAKQTPAKKVQWRVAAKQ